jgi:glycosyltransferase involved in cell wall biosynthesis
MLPQVAPTPTINAAFVLEQALGHITHARNLRAFVEQQTEVSPTWLPIPFDVNGTARLVPVLRSNWSVRASFRARRALDRLLAREHIDAILFHTQVTALFSRAIMRHVPSVISLDATPLNYDSVGAHYGHKPAGGNFVDRQKFRLNRDAFHAASALVTWSEWARRSVIDDYGVDAARVRVLAPGAARAFFDIGRARAARNASAEKRPTRLLFVGGDFDRKGGPLLVEAARDMLGEACELDLVTGAAVEAQPGIRVHRGVQANSPELLRLFSAADVFVLPTHAECLAVVLMEATAAGLPVITTDVGALSEAVKPEVSGMLIRPGNQDDLHSALRVLVDDPACRQRMGRAGNALAREKFDSEQNNRLTLDLLQEIVAADDRSRRVA